MLQINNGKQTYIGSEIQPIDFSNGTHLLGLDHKITFKGLVFCHQNIWSKNVFDFYKLNKTFSLQDSKAPET